MTYSVDFESNVFKSIKLFSNNTLDSSAFKHIKWIWFASYWMKSHQILCDHGNWFSINFRLNEPNWQWRTLKRFDGFGHLCMQWSTPTGRHLLPRRMEACARPCQEERALRHHSHKSTRQPWRMDIINETPDTRVFSGISQWPESTSSASSRSFGWVPFESEWSRRLVTDARQLTEEERKREQEAEIERMSQWPIQRRMKSAVGAYWCQKERTMKSGSDGSLNLRGYHRSDWTR
jgi:hypothetical protein